MAFKRFMVMLTAACFLALGVQSTASAGVIATQDYFTSVNRASQIEHIRSTLSRDDVRSEFMRMGVDPVAAAERVANLSDAEIAQISGKLAELPAGGDSLLAVVGIVFVVLLLFEVLGVTDVFKKI